MSTYRPAKQEEAIPFLCSELDDAMYVVGKRIGSGDCDPGVSEEFLKGQAFRLFIREIPQVLIGKLFLDTVSVECVVRTYCNRGKPRTSWSVLRKIILEERSEIPRRIGPVDLTVATSTDVWCGVTLAQVEASLAPLRPAVGSLSLLRVGERSSCPLKQDQYAPQQIPHVGK